MLVDMMYGINVRFCKAEQPTKSVKRSVNNATEQFYMYSPSFMKNAFFQRNNRDEIAKQQKYNKC